MARYERHRRAARMFAEEHLDSGRCLSKMLALCGCYVGPDEFSKNSELISTPNLRTTPSSPRRDSPLCSSLTWFNSFTALSLHSNKILSLCLD